MRLSRRQSTSRFLFGSRALQRLQSIDVSLRSLTAAELNATVSEYEPWFCAPNSFSLLSRKDQLLTEPEALRVISSQYSSSEESANLSVFGLDESGFRINSNFETDSRAQRIFNSALGHINSSDELGECFSSIVQCIVPIYSAKKEVREHGIGFSSVLARNAIFVSCPKVDGVADIELAVNMSHELGHQILHLYQSCDLLFESDNFAPVYSGIRKTDRPAILSLHAAVALGFMITAFESFNSKNIAIDESAEYIAKRLNELRADLIHTLVSLRKTHMTTLGRELVQELALCCG